MTRLVLLDATPLGQLSHPDRRHPIADWVMSVEREGTRIAVPEIADYEVRRELIRAKKIRGVRRLDALKQEHVYLKLTTPIMLVAAELWAKARSAGKPTASEKGLDGDMILAAQAILVEGQGYQVVVATDNIRHLSPFVDARRWQDIEIN